MPIYFQAVHSVDATESGVRSLPLIIGMSMYSTFLQASFTSGSASQLIHIPALTQIATGTIIGKIGIFNPFIIAGALVTTIGCGLLTTLKVSSGSAAWIGYQIIVGIGEGLCLNVPIIVTQRIAPAEDVAVATAVVLCKWRAFGVWFPISLTFCTSLPILWWCSHYAGNPIHLRKQVA